jgi:hypothetical protein
MDEHSKNLLKKSLKKSGLVETIVWNRRTGNVVGGHQRLGQLDALEKSQNYLLDVAVIDVDETEEREINIKLNNPSMMGLYDADKLSRLFIDDGVKFADTGFSALDIQINFDTPTANAILGTDKEELPEVVKDIEEIKKIKEIRKNIKEKATKKNTSDYFRVVVFNDPDSMEKFLSFFGFRSDTRYIDGEVLNTFIDEQTGEAAEETAEQATETAEETTAEPAEAEPAEQA